MSETIPNGEYCDGCEYLVIGGDSRFGTTSAATKCQLFKEYLLNTLSGRVVKCNICEEVFPDTEVNDD